MQPQVRLIFPIFNRPRPVFVNLKSQVFLVPWPTLPKSQTIFSKEILGKRLWAAKTDCCMPIDNERIRPVEANRRKTLFRFISYFLVIVMVIKGRFTGYFVYLHYPAPDDIIDKFGSYLTALGDLMMLLS